MISIKIKKTHLRDLVKLLRAADAVDGVCAYPSGVYISNQDYKELVKNVKKSFKKEYPGISPNALKNAVGIHLLNLGPNQSLGESIRPGYLLVDRKGIDQSIKNARE